jgi:RimJ/RimL family protein N-acetyltransferase
MPTSESRTLTIPILETERLKLRANRLDDFPACSELWADPIVTKFIGGKPLNQEESWARLLRYIGHWCLLGFGPWVVEEKSTGLFLGEVGFAEHQRDIQPSLKGIPEIGWVFSPRAHGKGFATEAVRAAFHSQPALVFFREPSAWSRRSNWRTLQLATRSTHFSLCAVRVGV